MEVHNNFNRYTNYTNNKQNMSFQGFVDPVIKKHVNHLIAKEIDAFTTKNGEELTEELIEKEVITPAKVAYRKLTAFMEKFPDDIGVSFTTNSPLREPYFFIKHADGNVEMLLHKQFYKNGRLSSTSQCEISDFVRFVREELGDARTYSPTKINDTADFLRAYKKKKNLINKIKKSKGSYLD